MRMRAGAMLAMAAMLSGCGGSDSGSVSTGGSTAATPTPTATAGCSLRERQDWAAAQLREWYLFPDTLPATLSPAAYSTVDDYIDALTATARAQRKDRYFTYLTSIKEETAYYTSGSSAGFGIRFALDQTGQRLFATESFEGAPALAAGIDRGTEILAIGTTAANLRTVSAIIAAEGTAGLTTALGPDTTGTARVFRVSDAAGARNVTVAKADFTLLPVSTRYGAKIIDDNGQRVGYINLRTFISTAEPALKAAFADFRAKGVTNVIVDLRYNGGGLVGTAEYLGDLLGGGRSTSEVFDYTTFRTEKASNNTTRFFAPQPESIAPTRIAFIGSGGTASASELVINAFTPYLHANAALIGTNTYGKPVGQIALDKPACDDRLRVIAFATQNAARNGNYFDGLASTVEATCRADDDIGYPLGDSREASTRRALDFLAGRTCSAITSDVSAQSARTTASTRKDLLIPTAPTTAQRMVPGSF
ncbi:peptidase S41-like protein [Sphingomonas sp. PP-CE-3A-406]|uniref:S41 family peptidase n=1 Tax=Sphingomonas sp. PP-CE-3A-406 TaxID=2135659 RepID=UPI000F0EB1AE|nr:S41 family peptidase [Sphingomonas sp. PP-CE-3A-406]RMB54051.1 peptidase S41-like protein [Sphingomonas sp. PP-CE-3A-406]